MKVRFRRKVDVIEYQPHFLPKYKMCPTIVHPERQIKRSNVIVDEGSYKYQPLPDGGSVARAVEIEQRAKAKAKRNS
jgi:hypothetical protein